jgi:predicted methyltransferase
MMDTPLLRFINMNKIIRAIALTSSTLFAFGAVNAVAADFEAVKSKLETAMADDVRTEADSARDRNRRPIETLEFFGLRDDMTVVELIPGGGWYTKLLAPVLAENGELHVAYGTGTVKKHLLTKPGFEAIGILGEDTEMGRAEGAKFYHAKNTDIDIKKVDMVLTFRNYHNFDAPSRANINNSVFKALKRGGTYGLVDHTKRHMQGENSENRRRFDPVLAIKEIEAAGFEFVDYSDLHYKADDELRYEVGRKTVTGNTDRWTLKFRKP